ncbi:MAG: hypothetical protein PUA75_08640 [Clostridiales bacterium]|nr:hypothetical protein [Clostridiales bacterium]
MKHIISAFGTLFVLLINIFICVGTATASSEAAAAKEYKADVIAEVENCNFNPNVIAACVAEAKELGYELSITKSVDVSNEVQSAEVILSYSYEIPVFGISQTKTTRGIAR